MYMELNLVTYTHSNCKDALQVHNELIDQHLKPDNHFIFSDYKTNDKNCLIYDDNEPYSLHYSNLIKQINKKYFIYHQEDFFIYNQVNRNKLLEYIQFLELNPDYSFVRLLKSGFTRGEKISDTLYSIETDSDQIFSMQPTIWRTQDLIKIYEDKIVQKLRDESEFISSCLKLNIKGAYHFNYEQKRGLGHFDSSIYPCICTALIRGKWNISEYAKELGNILTKFSIDPYKRGLYGC